MKVLHVIPGVAPRYGGPSQAVFEMCRGLQRRGAEVLVATTDADGEARLPVETDKVGVYQGVPTIFFKREWSEAFKYSRPLAAWLDASVCDFDAVHIHAVFSHACLAAARACRRRSVPYIVRPLGTLDPWSLRQKPLRKKLFWHFGVERMLHGAKVIHYTTADEMRLAEESLGLKGGRVVPLGLDLSALQDSIPDDASPEADVVTDGDPYILVLSRLHPKKNLALLVESFLKIAKHEGIERWRLVLAGDGDEAYVSSLKNLAAEAGQSKSVIFSGWLQGDRKVRALREAALLALPSHQENFGLCVAEAMACGVPVVVSPHVNLASDIRAADAGWIAPLDEESFTRVLMEAMSDEGGRRRRGAAGREYARRYASSEVAAGLLAMYGTAMNDDSAKVASTRRPLPSVSNYKPQP